MENNQESQKEQDTLLEKEKIDLDRILVEEIGQFGRFQCKTMLCAFVFIVILLSILSEFVFSTARIRSRCVIPECEKATELDVDNFLPVWWSHAIPAASGGSFDNCRRFAAARNNNDTFLDAQSNDTCSANIFDVNTTILCDAYVYENKNTVVYDFDLACDEWRRSLIGSARTLGTLFAQPLAGFISDRWGRRTALALCTLFGSSIGMIKIWIKSYVGFLIAGMCETTWASGVYMSTYLLMMEMVGPKYRKMVSVFFSMFVVTGHVYLLFLAWLLPNWRSMTLALYIPQFFSFFIIWFLSDSIRWYLGNERYDKAEKLLKKMARINGKELSTKTLLALKDSVSAQKDTTTSQENEEKQQWLAVEVFRYKPVLVRCLVTPVWWITFTFVFYGLTINSVNLPAGSKFTNFLLVTLCEIPGMLTAFFFVDRAGRKPVLAGGFYICGISQLAYIFVPTDYKYVCLALFMVGKCSISAVVMTLYMYTSELFPTKCRHRLAAYCSMLGRIGSIIAPLTPAFGEVIPFVMFGGISLLSGVLSWVMPETLGCKLPDTMEQAANLGSTKNTSKEDSNRLTR